MPLSDKSVLRPRLSICSLVESETLMDRVSRILQRDRYTVSQTHSPEMFCAALNRDRALIDCLIFEQNGGLPKLMRRLHREAILLPAVIVTMPSSVEGSSPSAESGDGSALDHVYYHTAEIHVPQDGLSELPQRIDHAIAEFLKLSPRCSLPNAHEVEDPSELQATLATQQQRLSDKLRERLGYIGIYYKRDSQLFFRHLSPSDREQFLNELKLDYRDIILSYFWKQSNVNPQIDAFVNKVFFADVSVSQVLEIHMELMERLAKKLKLEGRNEDILLDYRLTLIDTIAHLCEMYRRSIPREP
ncbi:MAG: circadian clock protein KaiA [Thermosynechococcaceae cyanobacterium]